MGIVDSRDKSNEGTADQMPAAQELYRRLRNEAAKLGANFVLLSENPSGMSSVSLVSGEAYKCPLPQG